MTVGDEHRVSGRQRFPAVTRSSGGESAGCSKTAVVPRVMASGFSATFGGSVTHRLSQ